jgi:hypothetical protein
MARKTADPERNVEREGDVLGISNADPAAPIPKPARKGSGHAEGIDVRGHASGIGDLTHGAGATGVDMGGGGAGTDVEPDAAHTGRSRPAQENKEE